MKTMVKMCKRLRAAALLLSLAAAASFTACAGGPSAPSDPGAAQVAATATPGFDEAAALSEAAREAYDAVMRGDAEFYSVENGESLLLQGFLTSGELYGMVLDAARYAALDMDGDGVPEAVLELTTGGIPEFYEVLHYENGTVYGYCIVYRGLEMLKTDGTFLYSNGAADYGYGTLKFREDAYETNVLAHTEPSSNDGGMVIAYDIGGESVTEAAFAAFEREQNAKEDAVWLAFPRADASHAAARFPVAFSLPRAKGFAILEQRIEPDGYAW